MLDRLLDLLLISVLRTWFDRPQSEPPAWYAAQSDPVVGPPLRLMQHHPEQPWTVAGLAAAPGCRAPRSPVGSPLSSGNRRWPSSPSGGLALAADLLLEPEATIATVARQVGYATPYALSAAFKRERGVSPRDHRARVTA